MKVLVSYSGGKDSLAALLWTLNESGFSKDSIEAVFCDTGWEHHLTYQHIKETTNILGVKLVTIKSKKYDGMLDMAKKKGRFPSTMARFCTENLKTIPFIDYVLDECNDHILVIQGIRGDESRSRALMKKQCTFFRYYYEPYKIDKKGKPKYHTYRKKDVIKFRQKYLDDVLRPCFEWTGLEVMNYILSHGMKPNPLYYQGSKRVGCYPCVMCSKSEIKGMIEHNSDYIERLKLAEEEVGMSFFPPDYVPSRYKSMRDEKSGKRYATVQDVVDYVNDKNNNRSLFEDEEKNDDRRCMSFYGICE